MTKELPQNVHSKEEISKLVALAVDGKLAVGNIINVMLSKVVANEVVSKVGSDFFETLRHAINGVPLKSVHEFLYNQHGCIYVVSQERGTRDYHKYIPREARTKHA